MIGNIDSSSYSSTATTGPIPPNRAATTFWRNHAVITSLNIRAVPKVAHIIEDLTLSDMEVVDKLHDVTFPRLRTLRLENLSRFPKHMSIPRLQTLCFKDCKISIPSSLSDKTSWWISGSVFTDTLHTLQIVNHQVPLQDVDLLLISSRCHQLRHVDFRQSSRLLSDWGILYIAFTNNHLEELLIESNMTTRRMQEFLHDYCPKARLTGCDLDQECSEAAKT